MTWTDKSLQSRSGGWGDRVLPYRCIERSIVASRPGAHVLDVGCGVGENLRRLRGYGGAAVGIEPDVARARESAAVSPTAVGVGEQLPFCAGSLEMVYVSHVLHHARDLDAVLAECLRVLVPGGLLFVIETVEDSPLLRLARFVQPSWEGDAVLNRFRFDELWSRVDGRGFEVEAGAKFNWIYFAWELLPIAFRPLHVFDPLFVGLDALLRRPLAAWGAHCWLVARKPGAPELWGASWR